MGDLKLENSSGMTIEKTRKHPSMEVLLPVSGLIENKALSILLYEKPTDSVPVWLQYQRGVALCLCPPVYNMVKQVLTSGTFQYQFHILSIF